MDARKHPHGKPLIACSKAKRRYPHGTRARYALAKCRCVPCRMANRAYENARSNASKRRYHLRYAPPVQRWVIRDTTNGAILSRFPRSRKAAALRELGRLNGPPLRPNQLVPAAPIATHLQSLRRHGVGIRHVADIANVSRSVLLQLLQGRIQHTRRSTAQRILTVTIKHLTDGALVSADTTTVLIHRLQTAGYRRSWISRQLGATHGALQIGKRERFITARTARAVHALYRALAKNNKRLPEISPAFTAAVTPPVCGIPNRRVDVRTAPHGSNERFENGCQCHKCQAAHDAYAAALANNAHYRYILRKGGARYRVFDSTTRTMTFSHRNRELAIAVRDASNAADPIAFRKVKVTSIAVRDAIDQLIAVGFNLPWLAQLLGRSTSSVATYRRNPKIHLGRAREILALYHCLEQRSELLGAFRNIA